MPCTSRNSLGAAARTAAGEPNRSNSAMRVCGPTPEISDSRSMSTNLDRRNS